MMNKHSKKETREDKQIGIQHASVIHWGNNQESRNLTSTIE